MKIKVLNDNIDIPLMERLFCVRNIDCDIDDFLNPSLKKYWGDVQKLADMDKAVSIIFEHIKKKSKIMIFGDYDVDGVTSSYLLYTFFTKFVGYKNVSIMYPDRLEDGYGLKCKHVDMMQEKGIDLIITVDNGITSIAEADHAKKLGLTLIITDHHHALDTIPNADAIVNPQISDDYTFKGIAGVGVAFKVMNALMDQCNWDKEKKKEIFEYLLPIVAIGTVADCVPLVNENRAMVKRGLEIINTQRDKIPESLRGFLDYMNIKENMSTFHIGFVIGPRINAGGRLASPYDSLRTLLHTGDKQKEYLEKLDTINTERKKLQDQAYKHAVEHINHDHNILIAIDPSYHEGVVGIVSGRLTEKHHKPSMILHKCERRGIAVGSLRAPEYFSVIDMLKSAEHLLTRFGGHKQAGGLTVSLENLDAIQQHFIDYTNTHINEEQIIKTITIDTMIMPADWKYAVLDQIQQLEPFGVGNEEPRFLLENCTVVSCDKVGQRGKGHLKMTVQFHEHRITALRRSNGDLIGDYPIGSQHHIIGKIKTDSFNGGYYIDCDQILSTS